MKRKLKWSLMKIGRSATNGYKAIGTLWLLALLYAIFMCVGALSSCNSGTKKEVFKPHSDTAHIWGTYVDFPSKNIMGGVTIRVLTKMVSVDSFLNTKEIIDTQIWIKPSIDTAFKQTIKGSVVYDLNVDTGVARLNRWIAANKNLWEKDSTVSDSQNKPIQ